MSIESRCSQYGTVFGHWSVCEFLGQGSEGKSAVFRLNHCESKEVFSALKVISLIEKRGSTQSLNAYQKREYEAARDRCTEIAQQEVLLMNSFQGNTNIVDYLDHTVVDWTDESGFGRDLLIRMELLRDLRSIMSRGRIFSEREVLKIGRDICSALVLCHRNNILHRDIKPENIFFSKSKSWKLGDFGVSRILSAAPMSTASTNVGTPQYAAPEQFFGQHDHRADIYSLGLVLYELSNQNRLPFAASSYILPDDVQRRYSGEPLPPPCNSGGVLTEVILKACAFNPEERFQTALEFLTALRQVSLNSGDSEYSSTRYSTYHPSGKSENLRQSYATVAAAPSEISQRKHVKAGENNLPKGRTRAKKSASAFIKILIGVLILGSILLLAAAIIMVNAFTADDTDVSRIETTVDKLIPTEVTFSTLPANAVETESILSTETAGVFPSEETRKENTAIVIERCNLQSSPSIGSRIITQLNAGNEVEVLRIEPIGISQWAYISCDAQNVMGWVVTDVLDIGTLQFSSDNMSLQPTQMETTVPPPLSPNAYSGKAGYITNAEGGLNVRQRPSTSADSVRRIYNGDRVTVLEELFTEGLQWGRISDGWICTNYVVFENGDSAASYSNNPSATITGTVNPYSGEINVRSGPGISYDSIGRIAGGKVIRIYEQTNVNGTFWGKTDTGWVCMDYIILGGTAPVSQSEKTTLVYSVEGQRQEVAATIQNNNGYSIAIPDDNWYFNHQRDVDTWENAILHEVRLYVYRPNGMSRSDAIKAFVQNHREYDFENLSDVYAGTGSAWASSFTSDMFCGFDCTSDGWIIAQECPIEACEGWGSLLTEMANSFTPK